MRTQANIRPLITFIFIRLYIQTYHQARLGTSNPYYRRRRVWLADWWRLRNWNFHYYRCLIQAALSIIGGSNGHLFHFFLRIDMDLGHLITEFTATTKTRLLRQQQKTNPIVLLASLGLLKILALDRSRNIIENELKVMREYLTLTAKDHPQQPSHHSHCRCTGSAIL